MASFARIRWMETLVFLSMATVAIIADLVIKTIVRTNMILGHVVPFEGRFRLNYSTNSGSVFSLPLDPTFLIILNTIGVVVLIWIYFHHFSHEGKLIGISLGIVLGGIVGNLTDRIRFGAVTDFIDVRLWGDFQWASFNIADASIAAGIMILICWTILKAKL